MKPEGFIWEFLSSYFNGYVFQNGSQNGIVYPQIYYGYNQQ